MLDDARDDTSGTLLLNFTSGRKTFFGIPNIPSVSGHIHARLENHFDAAPTGPYGVVISDFVDRQLVQAELHAYFDGSRARHVGRLGRSVPVSSRGSKLVVQREALTELLAAFVPTRGEGLVSAHRDSMCVGWSRQVVRRARCAGSSLERGSMVANERTQAEQGFERRAGLCIALLAAVLAVNDLFAGKFGEDEIIGTNEKANAYAWYQSKSQKQALHEHHKQLLETLNRAGFVPPEHRDVVLEQIGDLQNDLMRYSLEKREILLGSAAVGEEGWVIEIDGHKGSYTGVTVWEATLEVLDTAGHRFDLATLFLQVCLVLGAVSLVVEDMRTKQRFFYGMLGSGILGTFYCSWGLVTAFLA